MTNYIDTYISGPSLDALETFARNFVNFIPPVPGRVGVPASDGTPEIPQAGNPELYYTCIRSSIDITPLVVSPFAVIDYNTGASVVGVWA